MHLHLRLLQVAGSHFYKLPGGKLKPEEDGESCVTPPDWLCVWCDWLLR
jgi:hypothetical protein